MLFRKLSQSRTLLTRPSAAAGRLGVRCLVTSSSTSDRVDAAESAKFAHAAATWWDPNSDQGAGLLHALNPVRVRYITEVVAPHINSKKSPLSTAAGSSLERSAAQPLAGLRALDVGCGGGLLSESLARLGATVVGLDPTPAAVAAARQHASGDPVTSSRATYRLGTVFDLETEGAQFDLVCSLEVVEHVPDPDAFVGACANVVAPGGALVLSTMNRTPKAWLLAVLGAEHLGRLLPVGTHDWAKFRTPAEMTNAVERKVMSNSGNSSNGEVGDDGRSSKLTVRDTQGIVFKPQNLKLLSSPAAWGLDPNDLDVNYIMHALRPRDDVRE